MIISTASVPKSENESCWSSYEPGNLDRNTTRQVHLIDNGITIGDHIPNGTPENNGGYRHNTFTVLTLDGRRS